MHFKVGANGGTEAITILNNGSVGINNTAPDVKLSIKSSDESLEVVSDCPVSSTTGRAFQIKATGEEYSRSVFYSSGSYGLGSGSATRDTFLVRSGANTFRIGSVYDGSGDANLVVNGKIGIGQTTPTAVLHLKAGTASENTAPIKLTSGTVNTTPEAGAIEFDGTDFWISI